MTLKYWNITRIFLLTLLLLSHVRLFATSWTAAHQAPLLSTISWCLLKFISIELVMLANHLFLCRPLLLLPSIFPSIGVFSNESFQGLFGSSPQAGKVLELQSFQWIFRVDSLLDGLVWSPCSPRDSQESSALQFESINSLAHRLLYEPTFTSICTWLLQKP